MGVEVEHESGVARLMKSTCVAFCVAPIVLLGATVLVGWNEMNVVCQKKALVAAEDAVKTVGCTTVSEHTGDLVFLQGCKLSVTTPPQGPLDLIRKVQSNLDTQKVVAVQVTRMIWACEESKRSDTRKDSLGGGKTTTTAYSYKKAWVKYPQKTFKFPHEASQICGADYRAGVPAGAHKEGSFVGEGLKAGVYGISSLQSKLLFGDRPVTAYGSKGQILKNIPPPQLQMGDVKYNLAIALEGDLVTALGKQVDEGGKIAYWMSPAAWMCPSRDVTDLFSGSLAVEDVFDTLHAEAEYLNWILRVVGFALMWMAIAAFFAPLEVMADCIPCVGPYLGDAIEQIVCCVACFPAAACCLFVGAIFWVVVRPLLAIPAILLFLATFGAMLYFKATRKPVRTKDGDGDIAMVPLSA